MSTASAGRSGREAAVDKCAKRRRGSIFGARIRSAGALVPLALIFLDLSRAESSERTTAYAPRRARARDWPRWRTRLTTLAHARAPPPTALVLGWPPPCARYRRGAVHTRCTPLKRGDGAQGAPRYSDARMRLTCAPCARTTTHDTNPRARSCRIRRYQIFERLRNCEALTALRRGGRRSAMIARHARAHMTCHTPVEDISFPTRRGFTRSTGALTE